MILDLLRLIHLPRAPKWWVGILNWRIGCWLYGHKEVPWAPPGRAYAVASLENPMFIMGRRCSRCEVVLANPGILTPEGTKPLEDAHA